MKTHLPVHLLPASALESGAKVEIKKLRLSNPKSKF